jgi:hypothetical protein
MNGSKQHAIHLPDFLLQISPLFLRERRFQGEFLISEMWWKTLIIQNIVFEIRHLEEKRASGFRPDPTARLESAEHAKFLAQAPRLTSKTSARTAWLADRFGRW